MEVKQKISAKYADNAIDIEKISSDFSKLLGVDDSDRNVPRKNDSLIGLIFAPKEFSNTVGKFSLHIQTRKMAFLSFKSANKKLSTDEFIRLELLTKYQFRYINLSFVALYQCAKFKKHCH